MNTTESILEELATELAEHIGAGKHVMASECRQQIVAHETLARLRAEFEANPSDGLASQIRFWLRKVNRDIDPPEAAPKRRRNAAPAEHPTDPPSENA